MLLMIKELIRSALGSFGYEIRKKHERGFCAPYLSQLCGPKTVFDVGVGDGTYELYKAYPTAKFFLIEPLREFQGPIEKIANAYDCKIYYKAVSDEETTKEITVYTKGPQLSTFEDRPSAAKEVNSSERRLIEVTTLDAILRENQDIKTPILLKVDTEGHELEVLKGAKQLLELTDTVILEASIRKRFMDSYAFEDLILFMKKNGFIVFDFLNIYYAKGKPGANLIDIAFKRLDKQA